MKLSLVCGLLAAVSTCALGTASQSNAQDATVPNLAIVAKGAWSASTTYAKDDIVTARGSAWRALKTSKGKVPGSTSPNNAAYWEVLAAGFNPTGAWSSSRTYQPNELATYQGQTWRAKATNTAHTPAANATWELLVTKGATGAKGATGPAGPNTGVDVGSQGTPSISFTGDSNTGIFHPSTGKIALVEGGQLFLHNKGSGNTALGLTALTNNAGSSNTAVGSQSLQNNTSGGDNTAVGGDSLQANTSGSHNTAFGNQTLLQNQSGSFNTALGQSTLFANVTGAHNTAVGYEALNNSTTADNTAVGYQALRAQNSGTYNTAIGAFALTGITSGQENVAVGTGAGQGNQTGTDLVLIGYRAGYATTQGAYNIAIGYSAGYNNDGNRNIAIGGQAMSNGNTNDSIGIGFNALVGGGDGNIAIGSNAGTPANSGDAVGSGNILIGSRGFNTDTNTIRIGTNGQPDLQTSTFIAGIKDRAAMVAGIQVYIDSVTGQLSGPPPSSARYKEDIQPVEDLTGVLSKLRPVTFRYKAPAPDGTKPLQYGLIAEEVAEVMPYLGVFNADGTMRTVHYERLPTFLLAGWQAQQKTIAAQSEKIEVQAGELADLKERLRRLEARLPQQAALAK